MYAFRTKMYATQKPECTDQQRRFGRNSVELTRAPNSQKIKVSKLLEQSLTFGRDSEEEIQKETLKRFKRDAAAAQFETFQLDSDLIERQVNARWVTRTVFYSIGFCSGVLMVAI